MSKLFSKCEEKCLYFNNVLNTKKFRKGEGVFTLVIGAAIGTLVLIGFYLVAKDGLATWGNSFKTMVTL